MRQQIRGWLLDSLIDANQRSGHARRKLSRSPCWRRVRALLGDERCGSGCEKRLPSIELGLFAERYFSRACATISVPHRAESV
jgi:hypothetical protein